MNLLSEIRAKMQSSNCLLFIFIFIVYLHLSLIYLKGSLIDFLSFHFLLIFTLLIMLIIFNEIKIKNYFNNVNANNESLTAITAKSETKFKLIGVKFISSSLLNSDYFHNFDNTNKISFNGFYNTYSENDIVGFVYLTEDKQNCLQSFTLSLLREIITQQLTFIPKQFRFLCKDSWPVSEEQEKYLPYTCIVDECNVVRLQRQFHLPRFGIYELNEKFIGFIFISIDASCCEIRCTINSELKERLLDERNNEKRSFTIYDRNGWPLTTEQEMKLITIDLARENIIVIQFHAKKFNDKSDSCSDKIINNNNVNDDTNENSGTIEDENDDDCRVDEDDDEEGDIEENHSNSTDLESDYRDEIPTSAMSKDIISYPSHDSGLSANSETNSEKNPYLSMITSNANNDNIKLTKACKRNDMRTILISYCRQEAEQHARRLKFHLSELGCKVFLDIDEILAGDDWQDALSNAVVNCDIFVPLITPRYGYTVWTTREVKLADMKNKLIIPINFLNYWPPECLEILFATRQYLNWKSKSDLEISFEKEGDHAFDIRYWDDYYVEKIAHEIYKIKKKLAEQTIRSRSIQSSQVELIQSIEYNDNSSASSEVIEISEDQKVTVFESTQSFLPQIQYTAFKTESSKNLTLPIESRQIIEETCTVREVPLAGAQPSISMNPLVVIIADEMKRLLVEEIQAKLLENNFAVWSTIDIKSRFLSIETNSIQNHDVSPATPVYHSMPAYSADDLNYLLDFNFNEQPETLMTSSATATITTVVDKDERHKNLYQNLIQKRQSIASITTPINENVTFENESRCSSIFTFEEFDNCQTFRQKVNEAKIVLVILSKSFLDNKTCKSQLFYVTYRKSILFIRTEENDDDCGQNLPHWITKIFSTFTEKVINTSKYKCSNDYLTEIVEKITLMINIDAKLLNFDENISEKNFKGFVYYLRRNLNISDTNKICLFVCGGSQFTNKRNERICRSIGKLLARENDFIIASSGFYGAADIMAEAFFEERAKQEKCSDKFSSVFVTVLPHREETDMKMRCRQNSDGSLECVPFGKTLFIGNSMKERDLVIARMFHYCLLVDGGNYCSRLAKEFLWNDNIVIPISCAGGAEYENQISTGIPFTVDKDDWNNLKGLNNITEDEIARTAVKIIKRIDQLRGKIKIKKRISSSSALQQGNRHSSRYRNRPVRPSRSFKM